MRYERGGGRRDFSRNFAPVKVGDELNVKIEAVGEKGDGIAKKDGFVLFVPGTKQGDEVKIKVTRVLQKVGFAEVVGKGEESSSEEQQESYEQEQPQESQESSEEEYSGEDSENFGEENQ
ncbi:TRAM domain-containing protein [Candidatus Woesearchaeota archaeon]|nr:TRAM domain-containing protein [Candidatus Woesearchaeota archaeon]